MLKRRMHVGGRLERLWVLRVQRVVTREVEVLIRFHCVLYDRYTKEGTEWLGHAYAAKTRFGGSRARLEGQALREAIAERAFARSGRRCECTSATLSPKDFRVHVMMIESRQMLERRSKAQKYKDASVLVYSRRFRAGTDAQISGLGKPAPTSPLSHHVVSLRFFQ